MYDEPRMGAVRTYPATVVSAVIYDEIYRMPLYSHQNEMPDMPILFGSVVVPGWPVMWPVCWL